MHATMRAAVVHQSANSPNFGVQDMVGCGLDECGISCGFGCACMSTLGGCECWCENTSSAYAWLKGVDRADPDLVMSFTATDMPLSRLAELFEALFPGQILIPAARISELVTIEGAIRDIKLGQLIERIGLIPVRKPLEGRELAELVKSGDNGCC